MTEDEFRLGSMFPSLLVILNHLLFVILPIAPIKFLHVRSFLEGRVPCRDSPSRKESQYFLSFHEIDCTQSAPNVVSQSWNMVNIDNTIQYVKPIFAIPTPKLTQLSRKSTFIQNARHSSTVHPAVFARPRGVHWRKRNVEGEKSMISWRGCWSGLV